MAENTITPKVAEQTGHIDEGSPILRVHVVIRARTCDRELYPALRDAWKRLYEGAAFRFSDNPNGDAWNELSETMTAYQHVFHNVRPRDVPDGEGRE